MGWKERCCCLAIVLAVAGCGSESKPPPAPDDIAAIGSSVGDIVYQCQSVAAGFIEQPVRAELERDVDVLLATFERVSGDARYKVGASSGPRRDTSVRGELRLARNALTRCEPRLARRLDAALRRE